MKKLSIIVPCYNVEKYIDRCLDSLLQQSNHDFKAIIIDDGSTDFTAQIIQSYCKEYPELFEYHKKENGGIANARNFGLDLVDTEYFGFLDSDDYVKKDFVEKMLNKMIQCQSDVVICGFEWTYESSSKKNSVTLEGPYLPGKEMMLGLFATLWNKIYKTDFIRKTELRFPDGYRYEDASFLYRLVPFVRSVAFVEEPLIYYVQREGSITHTHNEKVKDMVYVFSDLLDTYHKTDNYSVYAKELEYIFIRFFLGNSFLRAVQIKDEEDRKKTLELSWGMLDNNFPNWKKNDCLNQNNGLKNTYYKLVNKSNYKLFAKLFQLIKK